MPPPAKLEPLLFTSYPNFGDFACIGKNKHRTCVHRNHFRSWLMMKEEDAPKISMSSMSMPPPERYIRARTLALEKQLSVATLPLQRAELLLELGWELKAGNTQLALSLAEEAAMLCEQDDSETARYHKAMSACLMGYCYRYLSDYAAAHAISEQSLTQFDTLNRPDGKAICLTNIGYVCLHLGKFAEANEYFQKAIRLHTQIDNKLGIAENLIALGRCHVEEFLQTREQPTLAQATNYLYSAHDYAEQLDPKQTLALVAFVLSETYKVMQNYRKALEYHEEYAHLWENFLSQESDLRLQLTEERFVLEREQKDLEIYRLKTIELAEAQEELKLLVEALQQADQRQSELLNQLAQKNAELERMAKEDALTGLYNRRYIDQLMQQAFQEAKSNGGKLTIGILDLDYFKRINDRFSHQIGDEVLRTVAQLMKARIGREGVVGRYGGEEFVIMFPNASLERAALVADTVRRAVETHEWASLHPELKVTLSMGLCADTSLPTFEKMIAQADEKLYEAKKNGRNQVRY
ncbi:MAG: GGDEF domain-containing protein [Chloroherpetonaceae bacterium]